MNLMLVVGAPGMGKSPFIRRLIGTDKRCLVFDIANEYGSRVKYSGQVPLGLSPNNNDMRSRYIGDNLSYFINLCSKKRHTICVFEEATGFFRGGTSKETMRLIINRFHTQNTYCFIFHSINSIPPGIMEIANYCILFRTNDEMKTVEQKFSRLSLAFKTLQTEPNGNQLTIKLL